MRSNIASKCTQRHVRMQQSQACMPDIHGRMHHPPLPHQATTRILPHAHVQPSMFLPSFLPPASKQTLVPSQPGPTATHTYCHTNTHTCTDTPHNLPTRAPTCTTCWSMMGRALRGCWKPGRSVSLSLSPTTLWFLRRAANTCRNFSLQRSPRGTAPSRAGVGV